MKKGRQVRKISIRVKCQPLTVNKSSTSCSLWCRSLKTEQIK